MTEALTNGLNVALAWLPASGWQRLAVDALWQSTQIGCGALLLARLWRERPAARSATVLLAAALCVVTPLASTAFRAGGWGLLSVEAGEVVPAIAVKQPAYYEPTSVRATHAMPNTIATEEVEATATPQGVWQALGAAWLVVSAVLLWRLTRSAWAIAQVCRTAQSCDDADTLGELARAAKNFGVRPPVLLLSDAVASPALVAWGQPRLLLPARLPAKDQLYPVFCHELAHLARRDGLGRLVMELLTVALPWQPLAWLLRCEFRTACEEACDDWAVASGADPVEFAAMLTDFIPCKASALALGMAESVPAARYRILRLLAMQNMPQPRLGLFLGIAGWIVAIGLLVTLALLQRGNWPWEGGNDLPPWGNSSIAFAAGNAAAPRELNKISLPTYVVEPPDVLLIDAVKVVPKPPLRIEPLDILKVTVVGTLSDQPISGPYSVEPDGTISLGYSYGSIKVGGLTLNEARDAIRKHLEAVLATPEVNLTLQESAGKQQIAGEHRIGPDGRVNMGTYGSVFVSGMTLAEVRAAIEKHLQQFLEKPEVSVDVFAYNSKVYYIVVEDVLGNVQIMRVPLTGNDTVLDALAQIKDISRVADKYIWIARPAADGSHAEQILPVDWDAIVKNGSTDTNWQLLPNDRLFVRAKK